MLHPLHLSPDTPAWVLAAVWPVLIVHIVAGLVALMSGAAALLSRKGERLHRGAGVVFLVSMLAMAGMGAAIAAAEFNRPTAIGGVFAGYLVVTGWVTVRRGQGEVGRFETLALFAAIVLAVAEAVFGVMGMNSPSGLIDRLPWQAAIAFAVVAAIAAIGDWRVIRRDGVSGPSRIARHLWRMCAALFIASGSFFLGQQKVLPEVIQGSPVLIVLALAPLVVMVFWLFRVRSPKAFGGRRTSLAARG